MGTLQFLDDFWRQVCPFFHDYEFIYILLDIISIFGFFKALFFIPKVLMLGEKKI